MKRPTTKTFPCWFTKSIIDRIKMKWRHRVKWLKGKGTTNDQYHYNEYCKRRKEVNREIETAHNACISFAENNITQDPQHFWSYIKSKSRHLSPIPILYEGQNLTGNNEVATAFAQHFQSIYNKSSSTKTTDNLLDEGQSQEECQNLFHVLEISISDIQKAIRKQTE